MAAGAEATPAVPAAALLKLLWLASPALPVGGFSYSEGLEAAVDAGLVGNEQQTRDWLLAQLELTLARADLAVVAQSMRAWRNEPPATGGTARADWLQALPVELQGEPPRPSWTPTPAPPPASAAAPAASAPTAAPPAEGFDPVRIEALNRWVRLTREGAELLLQTEQMGRSMVAWLETQAQASATRAEEAAPRDAPATLATAIPFDARAASANAAAPSAAAAGRAPASPDPRVAFLKSLSPAPTWPVAHALALAQSGAPMADALLAHAFGWAENMVGAALKAVPLGQNAGQRVLAALVEAMPDAVALAMALSDDERQAHSPGLAILSARHEEQYSRLFRS